MNRAVFDASALVKLAVEEPGSEQTVSAFTECDEPLAPAWGLLECAQALWRKAHRGEFPSDRIEMAYDRIAESELGAIDPMDLIPTALALALRLNHSVYDCLYIATALQEAAPLVTADAKLAALADRCGVEVLRIGAA